MTDILEFIMKLITVIVLLEKKINCNHCKITENHKSRKVSCSGISKTKTNWCNKHQGAREINDFSPSFTKELKTNCERK